MRLQVGAKTLCELANAGISTEEIRRSLEQLKDWLPDADQPLNQVTLLEKNVSFRQTCKIGSFQRWAAFWLFIDCGSVGRQAILPPSPGTDFAMTEAPQGR